MQLYKNIASRFPNLGITLRQARILEKPDYFVKKTFISAAYAAGGIVFIVFLFTQSLFSVLAFPFVLFFMFSYFIKSPEVKINKISRNISKELVFAGRFLIIEMEAGVPPYETFKNMAGNYKAIGIYFHEIVSKIDLGTPIEDAINQTIEDVPEEGLKKILWQVLNSINTGAEVVGSLRMVVEQIVREQRVAVEEYGKKLNPMAMFYMMMAVIVPSLGITMFIILTTFIGLNLSLPFLLMISMLIGFVQFMFLSLIKSSRPPVEL